MLSVKMALRSIGANKLRAALTMLEVKGLVKTLPGRRVTKK